MKRVVAVGLLALALAGCVMLGDSKDRALRKSPNFQQGYQDGCDAATAQGADLRDRPVGSPQKGDDVYRAGWSNGYQTCRGTNSIPGAAPDTGTINMPGPGH